MLDGVCTLQL